MRKQVEIQIPDFTNLQPQVKTLILEHLKKDKRSSAHIMAKKCKCSQSTAKRNLELLVSEGNAKDLGFFKHGGNRIRVYEIT